MKNLTYNYNIFLPVLALSSPFLYFTVTWSWDIRLNMLIFFYLIAAIFFIISLKKIVIDYSKKVIRIEYLNPIIRNAYIDFDSIIGYYDANILREDSVFLSLKNGKKIYIGKHQIKAYDDFISEIDKIIRIRN